MWICALYLTNSEMHMNQGTFLYEWAPCTLIPLWQKKVSRSNLKAGLLDFVQVKPDLKQLCQNNLISNLWCSERWKKVLKTSLHLPVSHKLLQMYKYQFRILVQNEYAKCFFRLIQYWTGTFYSTTLIKNCTYVSHLQIKHLWFLDSFSVTALIKLRSCFSVIFGMIWATSAAYMNKFYRNVWFIDLCSSDVSKPSVWCLL